MSPNSCSYKMKFFLDIIGIGDGYYNKYSDFIKAYKRYINKVSSQDEESGKQYGISSDLSDDNNLVEDFSSEYVEGNEVDSSY